MYTEERNYARPRMTRGADATERTTYEDSESWLAALRGSTAARGDALDALHALLLRGAHFELNRRRASLGHLGYGELDDLATQAADDARLAILSKLDTFRGASRFTTWAYKFVLLEAGVRARRRAWHGREISLDVRPVVGLARDRPFGAADAGGGRDAAGDRPRCAGRPHSSSA